MVGLKNNYKTMKYIKEYLKEVRFIEPLGEITSRDDTLYEMSGQSIYINGKDVDIFISDADYTYWLENKYEELLR